jgi:hypothetical protein
MKAETVVIVLGAAAAVILVQQIVGGFLRFRKSIDRHDEAVARRIPIEYVFEDDTVINRSSPPNNPQ